MTKAKKALGVILAVVMLASMFAFGSFAAEAGNATFEVTPSATQVEIGDTVTVSVKLTTDYYAAATSVPIYYDATLFDYVAGSFTGAEIFGAGATDIMSNNNNGCLTAGFVPRSSASGARAQVLNGVTLFTFQLTAKADGVSPVELKAEDQKRPGNMNGKLICGAYANSSVTSAVTTVGQTFTLKNSSVTVGSAAAPELQLSEIGEANGAVIDRVSTCNDGNGFIYGISTIEGESIANYLTTPSGSVNIVPNDMGNESTGAKIELLDDSGNVIETYIFVLFGDVNGDLAIDSSDVSDIESVAVYLNTDYYADDGTAWSMAADVNGDLSIDSSDVTDTEAVAMYTMFTTQAEFAAVVTANKGI